MNRIDFGILALFAIIIFANVVALPAAAIFTIGAKQTGDAVATMATESGLLPAADASLVAQR